MIKEQVEIESESVPSTNLLAPSNPFTLCATDQEEGSGQEAATFGA